MTPLLLTITGITLSFFLLWYLTSLWLRDASIVDIAWGLGFILIVTTCLLIVGPTMPLIVMAALIYTWGIRLASHIYHRKRRHPGEDFRYAQWRRDWGSTFWWRSLVQVFLLQGVIMILLSFPILWAAQHPVDTLTLPIWLGSGLWTLGFLIEAIADWQLSQFKRASAAGSIITTGLWRYSRHPNYFGESVQWWGIWVISLAAGSGYWTALSPALLTYFLLFVSGVPMLEKKYAANPAFQEYQRKTSVFVPWFPKQ